jgi:hypothetical protein
MTDSPHTKQYPRRSFMDVLEIVVPKVVLAPTTIAALLFVYGFILWTAWISFTKSRLLPRYEFAGFYQYIKLFTNDRWWVASKNLLIFGGLFVVLCILIGLLLAILLDQRIRAEGALRTIYLYPMALSFIVTGTAWKWILNPGLGLERLVHQMGFTDFTFDWLVDPEMAIYTVVIAGVWQSSGFVMALFLAGCAASTTPSSRPPRWTVPACRASTGGSSSPVCARSFSARSSFCPHRHQELRPGGRPHPRRPRLCLGSAGHLHVRLRLHPQPAGLWRRQRHGDAGRVMAIIIPYLYSELRQVQWIKRPESAQKPNAGQCRPRQAVHLQPADPFGPLFPGAPFRHGPHIGQEHGGHPHRQPDLHALGHHLRCLERGLEQRLHRWSAAGASVTISGTPSGSPSRGRSSPPSSGRSTGTSFPSGVFAEARCFFPCC